MARRYWLGSRRVYDIFHPNKEDRIPDRLFDFFRTFDPFMRVKVQLLEGWTICPVTDLVAVYVQNPDIIFIKKGAHNDETKRLDR